MKFNFEIEELTHDELVSIISGAMYGISYWASDINPTDLSDYETMETKLVEEGFLEENETVCIEDLLSKVLLEGKTLTIRDSETDKEYEINLDGIKKGVSKSIIEYENDFKIEYWDSYDCDKAIQIAIFDDVIYG